MEFQCWEVITVLTSIEVIFGGMMEIMGLMNSLSSSPHPLSAPLLSSYVPRRPRIPTVLGKTIQHTSCLGRFGDWTVQGQYSPAADVMDKAGTSTSDAYYRLLQVSEAESTLISETLEPKADIHYAICQLHGVRGDV